MRVWLDFEYNQNGPGNNLNTVCVALKEEGGHEHSYWLLDPEPRQKFLDHMESLYDEDATLVSWNAIAEASALLALGIDPMAYHWIDLWLEYRLVMNDNFTPSAVLGKHYDKGRVYEQPHMQSVKAPVGLESATYKLLGEYPKTKEERNYKTKMRNLILDTETFTDDQRKEILEYCRSDIKNLPLIEQKIYDLMERSLNPQDFSKYHSQKGSRADYSVLTAIMQDYGYPIYVEGAKKVVAKKDAILNQIRKDFNERWPEFGLFQYHEKSGKYVKKDTGLEKLAKKQIELRPELASKWIRTESGKFSFDTKKVLQNFFEIKNGWSKDQPAEFYHYYRKQESAFNSFKYPEDAAPKDKRNVLFAKGIITDDDRVHCFMNPFGAKTARSQPKATAYIFGKTSWLRSLVQPKPGRAIIEIDYAGQELFIQGLVSGDSNLILDYLSDDLYMSFAKRADSTIPRDATKKTHGEKRGMYKEAVLGIGYGMGPGSLSVGLSKKTGKQVSEGEAAVVIDRFNRSYPHFFRWKFDNYNKFKIKGYDQLKSGWTLFGGKTPLCKKRTINNFPIQGAGSEIMRTAVMKCYERNLNVLFTLHDALFIECDNDRDTLQESLQAFTECMREAFMEYFEGDINYWLTRGIKLEAEIWSPDYKPGKPLFHATHPDPGELEMKNGHVTGEIFLKNSEVKVKPYFVDGRAIEQLKITGDIVLSPENYKHFIDKFE